MILVVYFYIRLGDVYIKLSINGARMEERKKEKHRISCKYICNKKSAAYLSKSPKYM